MIIIPQSIDRCVVVSCAAGRCADGSMGQPPSQVRGLGILASHFPIERPIDLMAEICSQ